MKKKKLEDNNNNGFKIDLGGKSQGQTTATQQSHTHMQNQFD